MGNSGIPPGLKTIPFNKLPAFSQNFSKNTCQISKNLYNRYVPVNIGATSGCSAAGSVLGSGPRGRAFESPHSDHKNRRCFCISCFYFVVKTGRLEGPASALPTNLPKANWLGLRLRPPPVADERILGSSENACIFWGKGRVNGKTAVFPCLGETTVMALALTRSCRGRNFGPTRRRRAKKFRVTAKGRFNEASQKQGLASQEQISPSRLTPTIKTGDAFASPVFIYLRAAPQGPGPLVCSEPIRDQVPSPTAAGGR